MELTTMMELTTIMVAAAIIPVIPIIRDQDSRVVVSHQMEPFPRNQDFRLQTGQPGVGGQAGEPDEGVDVDVYVVGLFEGAMRNIEVLILFFKCVMVLLGLTA